MITRNDLPVFRMNFRSLASGDDVKFEEFVQFVLQEASLGSRHLDQHWRPQYDICLPCHIDYDFVGHYETLATDADYVVRRIANRSSAAAATAVRFPFSDVDSRNRNSRHFLRKFYANVSAHNVARLLRLYQRDSQVFGYEVPAEIRRKLPTLNRSTLN